MAALPDNERFVVWQDFMETNTEGFALTKGDIRAAVNAIDDFLVTNATALNSAIPQPARAALSTTQKALLLTAVVRQRYLTGA
jgi:hypothetical protein